MKKTLSSLLLGSVCMGITFGVYAGDEKEAPKGKEREKVEVKEEARSKENEHRDSRDSKESKESRDREEAHKPLHNVDLKEIAPATFRELEVVKRVELNESDLEIKIRASIRRLATPGWRDAETDLIEAGRASVPYLIEALGPNEHNYPIIAFNVGGHIKADSSRGTRERTLAEACAEVLTNLVTNHSDYSGEVPALNQRAWQEWWTLNGAKVSFGN